MAHTHGPWHIEGSFDDEVGVSIVGPDDTLICEVEPFTEQWTDEEIANAHLLAAAPDLYRQLKALVVQIEASAHLLVPPNVREAIAKAEGK